MGAAAEVEGVPSLYRSRPEHNLADTTAPSGSCAGKDVSAVGGPPDSSVMTTIGVQTRFLATTAVQTSSVTTAGVQTSQSPSRGSRQTEHTVADEPSFKDETRASKKPGTTAPTALPLSPRQPSPLRQSRSLARSPATSREDARMPSPDGSLTRVCVERQTLSGRWPPERTLSTTAAPAPLLEAAKPRSALEPSEPAEPTDPLASRGSLVRSSDVAGSAASLTRSGSLGRGVWPSSLTLEGYYAPSMFDVIDSLDSLPRPSRGSAQRLSSSHIGRSLLTTAIPPERDTGCGSVPMRVADKGVSSPPPRSREFDIHQRLHSTFSLASCSEAVQQKRATQDASASSVQGRNASLTGAATMQACLALDEIDDVLSLLSYATDTGASRESMEGQLVFA